MLAEAFLVGASETSPQTDDLGDKTHHGLRPSNCPLSFIMSVKRHRQFDRIKANELCKQAGIKPKF